GGGDRAGDDDLADGAGDPIEHRHDHELEGHRGDARADRLSGGVADDADERLACDEIVHQTRRAGDERERPRRKEHDAREDRDFGCRQLDVRGDADRTQREENAECPDVESDRRGLVAEHVLDPERHERHRDQARDRDEEIRAPRDRSHRRPSSLPKRIPGWFRAGIRRLSVALRSGLSFGGRLPEPSNDDLVRSIDLLVDLPSRSHQSVDVLLIFPHVGILADHRLALSGTPGSELARREGAADLRPERWPPFGIDTRGPTLQALVDRIALLRKARSLGTGRLLARYRGRNLSTAEATDD